MLVQKFQTLDAAVFREIEVMNDETMLGIDQMNIYNVTRFLIFLSWMFCLGWIFVKVT